MGGAVSNFAARGVLVIAIGIFALAGLSEARVAPKPNLRVASVGPAARTVAPGAKLTLTETTANAGRGRAGKSVTALFLSADARKDVRDRKLASVSVPGLKAGKRAKKTLSAAVPASLAARTYRLIACADDRRTLRETKEGDNCRTAVAAVSVTALPLPNPNPNPAANRLPLPAATLRRPSLVPVRRIRILRRPPIRQPRSKRCATRPTGPSTCRFRARS